MTRPTRRWRINGHDQAKVTLLLLGLLVGVFAAQVARILQVTRGNFTYSLDDPYIHLALAQQINAGNYGINPTEVASPSSSVIWPFLLSLTADLSVQDWIPLLWAFAATAGSVTLLVAVFWRLASTAWLAALLSIGAAAGLNLVGLAFSGMEHSLQVFLALAAGLGVVVVVQDGRLPAWLPYALVLGPLVRYENAAVSLACAVVLFACGYRRVALVTTTVWASMLVSFSVFLVWLGLDPLPSSVLAKTALGQSDSFLQSVLKSLGEALHEPSFAAGLLVLIVDLLIRRRWGVLHSYLAVVLSAHGVAGQFGWMYRYEAYMVAATLPVVTLMISGWTVGRVRMKWVRVGVGLFVALCLLPMARASFLSTGAAQGIWNQQAQTALFVRDYWQRPIAVNDLGIVAFRGGHRVLDLWGLASQEAREARLGRQDAWMSDLVERREIGLVAIYSEWFWGQIPDTWQQIGKIRADRVVASPFRDVDVYAVDMASAQDACRLLKAFQAEVPDGTSIITRCRWP